MGAPHGTLEERFWRHVRKEAACWEWLARRERHGGHGRLKKNGQMYPAHRVAWEIHNGEIPKGLNVLHTCDNAGCVNPSHLYVGTQAQNIADMHARGRYVKGALGKTWKWKKLNAQTQAP